jgi:hypothetical protein
LLVGADDLGGFGFAFLSLTGCYDSQRLTEVSSVAIPSVDAHFDLPDYGVVILHQAAVRSKGHVNRTVPKGTRIYFPRYPALRLRLRAGLN